MLIKILLGLAVIIVGIIIASRFQPQTYTVERTGTISAPVVASTGRPLHQSQRGLSVSQFTPPESVSLGQLAVDAAAPPWLMAPARATCLTYLTQSTTPVQQKAPALRESGLLSAPG